MEDYDRTNRDHDPIQHINGVYPSQYFDREVGRWKVLTKEEMQKAQQIGSNVVSEKSNIVNAMSLPADGGDTGYMDLGLDGTEKEVWIEINIDQDEWYSMASYYSSRGTHSLLYPSSYENTFNIRPGFPAKQLLLTNDLEVNSYTDALSSIYVYNDEQEIRVINESLNTATVSIDVIRKWS